VKGFVVLLSIVLTTFSLNVQAASGAHDRSPFIQKMLPAVRRARQQVLVRREEVLQLKRRWTGHRFSRRDHNNLSEISRYYQLTLPKVLTKGYWTQLLSRVDVLPISMILAQAINESAWGRSRFARLGHNYFGQWCFQAGCGIVPRHRPAGATYEVKRFRSPEASVASYLYNINTNRAYQHLRQIRARQRAQGQPLNSLQLIEGLKHYSQLGDRYTRILGDVIGHYQLTQYDLRAPL
jgi:Bax protein